MRIGNVVDLPQLTTPAAASAANRTYLYVKSDGLVYTKDSGGIERSMVDLASTQTITGTKSFSVMPTGTGIDQHNYGLRSQALVTGGGTITLDASYNFSWSARFIVLGGGSSASSTTSGYFDITMPASGTALNVAGGASARNFSASGVTLNVWEALWYVLPIGSTNTSVASNFWVTSYTAAMAPPNSNWILLAVRNGDGNNIVRVCTGQKMVAGGSFPDNGFGGSPLYDIGSRVYSANNAPPYPVTTVAGRTGAVTFTAADVGAGTFPTGSFVLNGNTYSANAGTYTPTSIAGSKGNYSGFRFTDQDVTLMFSATNNAHGFYKETAARWIFYFNDTGTLVQGTIPWGNLSNVPTLTNTVAGRSGTVTLTAADIGAGTFPGSLVVTGTLNTTSTLSENGNRVYNAANPPPNVGSTDDQILIYMGAG